MNENQITRRLVLGAIASAGTIAGFAWSALAQFKTSKEVAQYQQKPNGREHCEICPHFKSPNRCDLVEGDIYPNGWCRYFGQKK